MERILMTMVGFNFYLIKVTTHTPNYFTFVSLYPFKDISGDYFSEDENFFEIESIPLVKKCVSNIIEIYVRLYHQAAHFLAPYLNEHLNSEDHNELEVLVRKYIASSYTYTEFNYFSLQTEKHLIETHMNYHLTKSFPFANLYEMVDEVKNVEYCMNVVLEQNIDQIISVHYHDDIYAGTEVKNEFNLAEGEFPEERLLQEIFICWYSGPRLSTDKDPFRFPYFEERFNKFSEQKKLGLFLVCNTNKNLWMYNKILTKFWQNRY